MAEITHGIRAILSHPKIYSLFQILMGGQKSRKAFVDKSIKPFSGMNILDIGCGPADILEFLPDPYYWGFDINEKYILHAQKKFGNRGNFQCKEIQVSDLTHLPQFDVVLALGLLHHLEDSTATTIIQLASKALKKNGRLITIDPCFEPYQNRIARFLIQNDRGQNVRNKDGYNALVGKNFTSIEVDVRHQSWIPYTHCVMVCRK